MVLKEYSFTYFNLSCLLWAQANFLLMTQQPLLHTSRIDQNISNIFSRTSVCNLWALTFYEKYFESTARTP